MLGQFIGYAVIAYVLLPLYYRLQLTSIYDYLGQRLGPRAYRSGAGFFILSRTLGATARLYLVVKVLQDAILAQMGLPFWFTALAILLMILLYTFKGGVKTIVWTDTLQTAAMLTGLLVCVAFLLHSLDLTLGQSLTALDAAGLSQVFVDDPFSRSFWGKQVLAGMFIAIAMTGMDQEMMQKNISVKRLADSQKNVMLLATIMLGVVALFLFLGGLLHLFAAQAGITAKGDALFGAVVHAASAGRGAAGVRDRADLGAVPQRRRRHHRADLQHFCIDLLGMQRRSDWSEARKQQVRKAVHLGFAALFMLLVMGFKWLDDPSMVGLILKIAGYTYGPLLGLFAFGILTRQAVHDRWVPLVALSAPLICWWLDSQQKRLFGSYELGLELLLLNGALTFAGLWLLRKGKHSSRQELQSIERTQGSRCRLSGTPVTCAMIQLMQCSFVSTSQGVICHAQAQFPALDSRSPAVRRRAGTGPRR